MLSQLLPMLAITFTVFVLFFVFMGIGYMVKKKPLKGSCGGVAKLMGDETARFAGMILINATLSSLNNKKTR